MILAEWRKFCEHIVLSWFLLETWIEVGDVPFQSGWALKMTREMYSRSFHVPLVSSSTFPVLRFRGSQFNGSCP